MNHTLADNLLTFRISKESIIDVCAVVQSTPSKIDSCTQQDVELHVKQVMLSAWAF